MSDGEQFNACSDGEAEGVMASVSRRPFQLRRELARRNSGIVLGLIFGTEQEILMLLRFFQLLSRLPLSVLHAFGVLIGRVVPSKYFWSHNRYKRLQGVAAPEAEAVA